MVGCHCGTLMGNKEGLSPDGWRQSKVGPRLRVYAKPISEDRVRAATSIIQDFCTSMDLPESSVSFLRRFRTSPSIRRWNDLKGLRLASQLGSTLFTSTSGAACCSHELAGNGYHIVAISTSHVPEHIPTRTSPPLIPSSVCPCSLHLLGLLLPLRGKGDLPLPYDRTRFGLCGFAPLSS